jgi:hypothetical protein
MRRPPVRFAATNHLRSPRKQPSPAVTCVVPGKRLRHRQTHHDRNQGHALAESVVGHHHASIVMLGTANGLRHG